VSLTVVARGIRFLPNTLSAPAGATITATLDNQDEGTPHDLTFRDPGGTTIAATDIFNGPGQQSVTFTPAGPGSYGFVCTVHPTQMTGRLTVQ
jgi:plastocyanin